MRSHRHGHTGSLTDMQKGALSFPAAKAKGVMALPGPGWLPRAFRAVRVLVHTPWGGRACSPLLCEANKNILRIDRPAGVPLRPEPLIGQVGVGLPLDLRFSAERELAPEGCLARVWGDATGTELTVAAKHPTVHRTGLPNKQLWP